MQPSRLSDCSSPVLVPAMGFFGGLARRLLLIAPELLTRQSGRDRAHELMNVPLADYFYRKRGSFGEMVPQPRLGIHSFLLYCLLRASVCGVEGVGSWAGLSGFTSPPDMSG